MVELIQNGVRIIHEDLYLVSTHVHDYVTYRFDADGLELGIDGGLEYTRRGGDLWQVHDRYEEWCLNTESPWELICDKLLWGTMGKDGKGPLEIRPIKELAARPDGAAHMRAILAYPSIGPWHRKVIEHWLKVNA